MDSHALAFSHRVTISPVEYAFVTGLSLATTYRRIASGEIKSLKLGRRVLIPRTEAERLLQPQEQSA
jgi:excisionase family DNA binding protein